jgi:hypothetical protein
MNYKLLMGSLCCSDRDAEMGLSIPLAGGGQRKLNLRIDNMVDSPLNQTPRSNQSVHPPPCATCMYFRKKAQSGLKSIDEHIGNGDANSNHSQHSKFLKSPANSQLSRRRKGTSRETTSEDFTSKA